MAEGNDIDLEAISMKNENVRKSELTREKQRLLWEDKNMASKNIMELQEDLARLKQKEIRLKEELALKKKAAEIRTQKDLIKRKLVFAEIFTEQFDEKILDHTDEIKFFISQHTQEITDIISTFGYQE